MRIDCFFYVEELLFSSEKEQMQNEKVGLQPNPQPNIMFLCFFRSHISLPNYRMHKE